MISDRTYGETTSFKARKLASCVQFQFKPERFVDAVSVENFIAEQDTKRCKTFEKKKLWVYQPSSCGKLTTVQEFDS